jgi:hypothetical protein
VITVFGLGIFLAGLVTILTSYKKIITAVYYGYTPGWLGDLFPHKEENPLDLYLKKGKEIIGDIRKFSLIVTVILGCFLMVFRANEFYFVLISVLLGFGITLLLMLYPNIKTNFLGYYRHSTTIRWAQRFPWYDDHFRSLIGKTVRSGGVIIYYLTVITSPDMNIFFSTAGIAMVSLSPIIWGELTKSPKASFPYFPAFLGLLIMIGHGSFITIEYFHLKEYPLISAIIFGIIITGAIWNYKKFIKDIYPARMAVSWLNKKMEKLGIRCFYTYDTPYNNSFIGVLLHENPGHYEVKIINSLKEVKKGVIFVPSTSSKAFNMESEKCALRGNFESDPVLTCLIDTKKIARFALASFKTYGTSLFWTQSVDHLSYRDLISKEINDYDRWRGHAWLLDAEKIQGELCKNDYYCYPNYESI